MKEPHEIIRKIENDFAVIGLRKDGIVHVYYRARTEITVEVQKVMQIAFDEITGQKKSLFIFEAGEYTTVNKEAREHAIQMEAQTPTKATVVYVTSLAHKIIAEFYYKFNKPTQPYKVSNDFDEGIRWLLDVEREIEEREGSQN